MKTIHIENEVLADLYGGCQDSLNEVFSEFISSYEGMTQSLISAFNSGNLSSLKRLLHFHGPSYMYLGLPMVSESFRQLEQKCLEAGNHFVISGEFMELKKMMDLSYEEVIRHTVYMKKAI